MRALAISYFEDDEKCGSWYGKDSRHFDDPAWGSLHSRREALKPDFLLFSRNRSDFDTLVAQWREDATYESMTYRVAMGPAYQEMIGMGRTALPLILARLTTDQSPHWLWALRAISREDPAEATTDVGSAVKAWLEWGQSKGYVRG